MDESDKEDLNFALQYNQDRNYYTVKTSDIKESLESTDCISPVDKHDFDANKTYWIKIRVCDFDCADELFSLNHCHYSYSPGKIVLIHRINFALVRYNDEKLKKFISPIIHLKVNKKFQSHIMPKHDQDFDKTRNYSIKYSDCEYNCTENHIHYSYCTATIIALSESREALEEKLRLMNKRPKYPNPKYLSTESDIEEEDSEDSDKPSKKTKTSNFGFKQIVKDSTSQKALREIENNLFSNFLSQPSSPSAPPKDNSEINPKPACKPYRPGPKSSKKPTMRDQENKNVDENDAIDIKKNEEAERDIAAGNEDDDNIDKNEKSLSDGNLSDPPENNEEGKNGGTEATTTTKKKGTYNDHLEKKKRISGDERVKKLKAAYNIISKKLCQAKKDDSEDVE